MLFSSKSNNPKQLISTHIPMGFSNEHAKLYMIFHWFPMYFFPHPYELTIRLLFFPY